MADIINRYSGTLNLEGGGVYVNRIFGFNETKAFDPFLMLDYLQDDDVSDNPGFPWHPHRGIETLTYIIKGHNQHEDSMGNKGELKSGEVQWMSAGKGVYHQEMPLEGSRDGVQFFQFWINMPAKEKMNSPKYNYIHQGEMKIYKENGAEVKIIAGAYNGIPGLIDKSNLGINLFHVSLNRNSSIKLNRDVNKQGFIAVFQGNGQFNKTAIESITAYTISSGEFEVKSLSDNMQFIFAEGIPLNEPIAWRGPIVMNTEEELNTAFKELQDGTFL